ncbi:nitroreductase family protein [Clostridium sp.]|uniref:nitroreductase family protein n=1 Tax=Clostridium sp. TaxID=1506 RepID=UPI003F3B70D9
MNKVLEVLKNRSSLRKYKDEKISKDDLDLILEGAMRAPTAGNMMLYSIIKVEDYEKKLTLSKTCDNQPFIATAPVVLIFLADLQRWFDYYEHSNVREYCIKNNKEFETPDEGDLLLAIQDAMAAAQNAVIAAESLGIGSCYIGDIIEHYEIHKELFNLPPWAAPISMLCLGYKEENINNDIKDRFNSKYIVFDEKYNRLSGEDFEEMYKGKEKLVLENNVYKAENYGQLIYGRKTGAEFSKEMERSSKLIIKTWVEGK